MNIEGVEILSQNIIYSPQIYGIIFVIILGVLAFLFLGLWIENDIGDWGVFAFIGIFSLTIISGFIIFDNKPNAFNYPNRIQYEIEIIDDNAWKELGPNYTVLNKLYETKEIYLIEGDYKND